MQQQQTGFKYTFLSKWTVLILTLITIGLSVLFTSIVFQWPFQLPATSIAGTIGLAFLLLILAILAYLAALIIGFADSIQEGAYGWTIALVLLIPFLVGPFLYSFFGPKNRK